MMPKIYIPERNHIIWLDFEPAKGKEIGKYRPTLVLSSKEYNIKSGLVICCPISSSARGASTEVPINNLENENSVVAANLIQTMSWKERKAKFITEAKPGIFTEVLFRIIPLIGAEHIMENYLESMKEELV